MAVNMQKHGRTHDAEGAREAILDAAEEVFAEHGFDGARIDAIAAKAGYNKSLIFQYFHDKLGVYSAVIRRMDEQTRGVQNQVLEMLLHEVEAPEVGRLIDILKNYLAVYTDYLLAHPRIVRILLWEMAEQWQTYSKVLTEMDMRDLEQFAPLLERLKRSGMFRSDFDPMAQIVFVEFLVPCYMALLPLYSMLVPGQDPASAQSLQQAREFLLEFVARGIIADPPNLP